MVALMEGGRYTFLLPLKKTIDVPTNKTNVYTAGHDGPIRGFLPWWLRTKSKIGFQILLKIKKKADAKSGPDESSGPDDKNRTDRTVRTLPFSFISKIYHLLIHWKVIQLASWIFPVDR